MTISRKRILEPAFGPEFDPDVQAELEASYQAWNETYRDVVTERSWPQYLREGFVPLPPIPGKDIALMDEHEFELNLGTTFREVGFENVRTGSVFDKDSGKPRDDLPGRNIYVAYEPYRDYLASITDEDRASAREILELLSTPLPEDPEELAQYFIEFYRREHERDD